MSYPTGTAMVDAAQTLFGEQTENSITAAMWLQFLNLAVSDVFVALPLEEKKDEITTVAVAISAGKGTIPSDIDQLLDVEIDGYSAHRVGLDAFAVMSRNPYTIPLVPIWAQNLETLYVRDDTDDAPATTITYIPLPSDITVVGNAVIMPKFHDAIIHMMVSHAFAQEEDLGQARHFRDLAFALINKTTPAGEHQQAVEGGQEGS